MVTIGARNLGHSMREWAKHFLNYVGIYHLMEYFLGDIILVIYSSKQHAVKLC